MRVRDILLISGGNMKFIFYDISNNEYNELLRGIVDDIVEDLPYGDFTVDSLTIVNNEDILSICIDLNELDCDDCIHLHYLGDKIIYDCEECNNMNCYREEC